MEMPPQEARMFPLSPGQISRRIDVAAAVAGLEGNFSGHSGRVGLAVRMTGAGAPVQAVATQGRWTDPRTVARYTKRIEAGHALPYRER